MTTDFRMPSLGADMDAGTLVEWRVKPGDRVERGDIVAVVETEKAAVEVETFAGGVVNECLVQPGEKVPVGTVLMRLGDDQAPGPRAPEDAAPVAPPAADTAAATAAPDRPAAPPPEAAPVPGEVSATPAPARLRISPAARRRALELGVAVAELRGSGPHGAIVLRDVDGAARLRGAAPVGQPAPPASARAQPAPAAAVPQRGAASPALRAAIAAAMSRSKRQIPHYYLSHTFSMMRCRDWLATENARRPVDERLLPGALLLKAVAVATWEVPEMNGFWQEDRFVPGESVHLGVAISLRGGGVIAPAILDADDKPVEQLMAELRDLVARTRARSLRSSELAAPTITVTSLGDRSPEAVWGVIYPPQVAIVGFGGICERPWVEDGSVVCHPVLTATLSADHRASDGHRGGLFLMAIERLLQEPGKL